MKQTIDTWTPEPSLVPGEVCDELLGRIRGMTNEVSRDEQQRIGEILDDPRRDGEARRDAVSTRLMECFRLHRGRGCFGLLYELNSHHLLIQVAGRLRRYASHADPRDVLQEVFFNVHRYPHRFNCEREDAFRVWSAMIVRNTVLKHLRSQGKGGRRIVPFEDLSDQPEAKASEPLGGVIEAESLEECSRIYLNYLHLYLRFYSMLSERERSALNMVEVANLSYKEAARELGIKLENLKMVIFRARRKIHRSMRRVFEGLPPDCRPARDPKSEKPLRVAGAKRAARTAKDGAQ
ncbi:MAG: RNA polymerase sigma factor [Planctomycetota bacterium]|nr:RNA polymerase sigma factor [Planctomycetota bacterium]MDP6518656.1 RNA polymerase sigma factor [Planctomycetota bacterium]MDP6839195.1 RNA polymerase sigma factor [Planctomycetota bacterium]MDP6955471.1 RNA polymerase sigma factor [Planctomycetota bacterium]